MNDADFYSVLNQLWPTMLGAIKTPNDAMVIGNIGREVEHRLELTKRVETKAEVPPSDGKVD